MKTEETTIVYAPWDVIKHHMITTDVISQKL